MGYRIKTLSEQNKTIIGICLLIATSIGWFISLNLWLTPIKAISGVIAFGLLALLTSTQGLLFNDYPDRQVYTIRRRQNRLFIAGIHSLLGFVIFNINGFPPGA